MRNNFKKKNYKNFIFQKKIRKISLSSDKGQETLFLIWSFERKDFLLNFSKKTNSIFLGGFFVDLRKRYEEYLFKKYLWLKKSLSNFCVHKFIYSYNVLFYWGYVPWWTNFSSQYFFSNSIPISIQTLRFFLAKLKREFFLVSPTNLIRGSPKKLRIWEKNFERINFCPKTF